MKLSRREFIFGTAAALAIVALPVELEPAIIRKQAFLNPGAQGLKRIWQLGFSSDLSQVASVSIHVSRTPEPFLRYSEFLRFAIGPGGRLLWTAVPSNELILLPNDTFRISAEPCGGKAEASVCYKTDDGRNYIEQFDFLENTPTGQRIPLDAPD